MKMSIGVNLAMLVTYFFLFSPSVTYCQTTITSTGNWSNSGIWSGGNIGDVSTENVNMLNTVGVTIQTGESFTIGNLTANNSNSITISTGGSLHLSPGSFLDAGNGTTITVNGDFTVNGNFTVNNNVTLIVTGTMSVTGTVDMGTNGNLNVSGALSISGNFVGQNNTSVTVSGSITVAGSVSVDNGSTLNGPGTFSVGGTCLDGSSGFCSDSQLPIELIFFKHEVKINSVDLKWSTASEINFDHFVLEKSNNGTQFAELAHIKGSGTSNTRKDYSYTDHNPFIGNSYYRLTSVDFDGYTEVFYNSVVHVNFKSEKNFHIAPNPIQGLSLKGGVNFEASQGQVVIYDRMGSVVGRYGVSDSAFELQLPNLSNGIYFAQLHSGEFTKSIRFVVNQ